ncbi:MAG: RDD family protein [Bryobacterales bacterium]|nr:RDD family protein [Bryobacterales bacterium]
MKCPRCSTSNSAYETRCIRCGSSFSASGNTGTAFTHNFGTQSGTVKPFVIAREPRLSQVVPNAVTSTAPAMEMQPGLVSTESTARNLDPRLDTQAAESGHRTSAPARPLPERPRLEMVPPGNQPSLFSPGDFAGRPASLRLERTDATHGYVVPAKRKPARKRKKSDMLPFEQGTLEFLTPIGTPARQLATSVEASVKCDHPVASRTHRILGAAWDGVLIIFLSVALSAVFAGCLRLWHVDFPMSAASIKLALGVVLGGVAIAYYTLFVTCEWETPGWRAVGLRLVRLDGQNPTWRQRWLRYAAEFISLAAAGAGYMWILFEEERLGWHDQISGTFPTPRIQSESNFRKR